VKRILLGLAVLASIGLAVPAAAAESTTATAFQAYCKSDDGSGAKALAAADAAGWAPIPDAFMASMGSAETMKLHSGGARATVVDRKLVMLLAGRGVMGTTEADFCAIITFAAEADAAVRDIRAVTGKPPIKVDSSDLKDFSMWAFVEGPGGREYFSDANSRKAMRAMSEGRLNMLMAGNQDGMTMIMQMRPEMPE
jgi:hypothetical protein